MQWPPMRNHGGQLKLVRWSLTPQPATLRESEEDESIEQLEAVLVHAQHGHTLDSPYIHQCH